MGGRWRSPTGKPPPFRKSDAMIASVGIAIELSAPDSNCPVESESAVVPIAPKTFTSEMSKTGATTTTRCFSLGENSCRKNLWKLARMKSVSQSGGRNG